MQITSQASLLPYNTFGIDAEAVRLIRIDHPDDLLEIPDEIQTGLLIGGGSNILLSHSRYPLVVINRIKGIDIVRESSDAVEISIGSGENWHELVQWALDRSYGGLENLSLIPGTVGAAPIQNIGAYGVEIKDVLVGLDFYFFDYNRLEYISAEQCRLDYRDSIFKNEWKNKGIITRIHLRLSKNNHTIHAEYNALKHFLEIKKWHTPTIHQISEAVMQIRRSKLPDWREFGNAGSFFKNPVVSKSFYENLILDNPEAPSFFVDENHVKVPAAWLIQESGFKGIRRGNVGTYAFQPLVLVNYGGGTAAEILNLKDEIQEEVFKRFGIELIPEVTIL